MKKLTLLFLLFSATYLLKANTQDSIIHSQNDSILFTNNCKVNFKNYSMGISSQLTGTYKLNTSSGPLLVIDGIPYPDRTASNLNYTTIDFNDIAHLALIPLESIESVELLDYNTTTQLYGPEAKNGVLSITTKKHSSKKLQVNYSFRTTFSKQPQSYKMLNGDEYSMMMKQALYNAFPEISLTDFPFFSYDNSWSEYENFNNNTDWQDAITQNGNNIEHYLSLSGQKNRLGYQLYANYNKGKGTMICTSDKDYSVHLNLSYQLPKILSAKFHINYCNTTNNSYNTHNDLDLFEGALKAMPNMSIYESNTDGTLTPNYYLPPLDIYDSNYQNPIYYANETSQKEENETLNPTFTLEVTPIKRLKYKLITSITDYEYNYNNSDIPATYTSTRKHTHNKYKKNTLYIINAINYFLIQNSSNQLMLSTNYSIYNWNSEENSQTPTNYITINNSSKDKQKRQKICGGITYSALDRYFISLGINYEDNHFNHEKNHFEINESRNSGHSYVINAKWIISNEAFFNPLSFINHLSISASGNYHDIPVSYKNSETQNKIALNGQLQFFERFSFNINYYKREIKDQLTDQLTNSLPPSSGYSTPNYIKQDLLNNGWEFYTNIALVNKINFKLNFFADLYKNTYQLTDTNDDLEKSDICWNGCYSKHISLNEEYGKIYGVTYNGVYQYNEYINGVQENAQIARDADGNIMYDNDNNPLILTYLSDGVYYQFQGGDAIYEDVDYNGRIDKNDIKKIGNAQPKISGTTGTSMEYKNWYLGIFFNFRYGNDIVNLARMNLESMYSYSNQTTAVNNRWRQDGDKTDIPRALFSSGHNWLGSTRFVENGSFFRLKTITLRHQLSNNITSKLHLSSLSLYLTAKNLFAITNYQGADPDISLNTAWDNYGYDNNYKAAIKQWILGIDICL